MSDYILMASLLAGMVSIGVARYLAPRWAVQARIKKRLANQGVSEQADSFSDWLTGYSKRFLALALVRTDFEELDLALETSGHSDSRRQLLYLSLCWLLPAVVVVLSLAFLGSVATAVAIPIGFLLPRRIIRAQGRRAEQRQNLEAIELCNLTRMLMEAGLSIERALRLIAVQARPIVPGLSLRLDRFDRMINSGAGRNEALDELGKNRRIVVLCAFVNLMKHSGALGTGVSVSLAQIVREAQHQERSRMKEATNRIGAKMTIVMMVFMLPSLFLLIGGPAVLSIVESLAR